MRKLTVSTHCDVCGKTEQCPSTYNEFYDLWHGNLPDGWDTFDGNDFPWIAFKGDQCPECIASFKKYVNLFFNCWAKFRISENWSLHTDQSNDP